MYRVVGCRECDELWIVADQPETTGCPRCGTRYRFDALQVFAETDAEPAAREARAALLADRAGQADAVDDLAAAVDGQLDSHRSPDGVDLRATGIDTDAVAEAGRRATTGPPRPPAHRDIVLEAIDTLDRPTSAEIIDYAADRDVPAETVTTLLERLVAAGDVTESAGRYRRL